MLLAAINKPTCRGKNVTCRDKETLLAATETIKKRSATETIKQVSCRDGNHKKPTTETIKTLPATTETIKNQRRKPYENVG